MKQYKKANLQLADPGLSNHSKKIKEQNELIIKELKKIRLGPFGIKKWLNNGV